MQTSLEHTGPWIFDERGSIAALWVGLGIVLGVLGAQLWPTSTHAITLQAMATVRATPASMLAEAEPTAAQRKAVGISRQLAFPLGTMTPERRLSLKSRLNELNTVIWAASPQATTIDPNVRETVERSIAAYGP